MQQEPGKEKGSRRKEWLTVPNAAKSTRHGLKMKMCHGQNDKEVTKCPL